MRIFPRMAGGEPSLSPSPFTLFLVLFLFSRSLSL
uniref:Uncharacterized protein n=1 Tax=Arundo donax TaxID=35708 RepID=A0A0A8XU64_ARUDO